MQHGTGSSRRVISLFKVVEMNLYEHDEWLLRLKDYTRQLERLLQVGRKQRRYNDIDDQIMNPLVGNCWL